METMAHLHLLRRWDSQGPQSLSLPGSLLPIPCSECGMGLGPCPELGTAEGVSGGLGQRSHRGLAAQVCQGGHCLGPGRHVRVCTLPSPDVGQPGQKREEAGWPPGSPSAEQRPTSPGGGAMEGPGILPTHPVDGGCSAFLKGTP